MLEWQGPYPACRKDRRFVKDRHLSCSGLQGGPLIPELLSLTASHCER